MRPALFLLGCVLLFATLDVGQGGKLRKKFYRRTSCPQAEDIIKTRTTQLVSSNPALPAQLLRMQFHDCFVRGCDASVLLNSTANNTAEREAIPNQTLKGFEAIDDIKATVEAKCPGVVSCADIIALATRDAVSIPFKKPLWEVLTGRRDGRVSKSQEALVNIPPPFFNFTQLRASFARKGLTLHELVVLSGAHTIGIAHCNSFSNRLFNFTGKGDQDPSLDPKYAEFLKSKCKGLSDNTTIVEMDPKSSTTFDSDYYSSLLKNKGLFESDAALLTNKQAKKTVHELVDQEDFFTEFSQAMKRLGNIEVLAGTSGEIRKKCWVRRKVRPLRRFTVSNMRSTLCLLAYLLLFASLVVGQGDKLRKNFYRRASCPQAEDIIKTRTTQLVSSNPALPAQLLRLHFHDCFVRGCDASVLLSSTANNTAERDSIPNLTLKGFEAIDDIKATVEAQCPEVVSCSDILALATRDAVSIPFKNPLWDVPTGRRDGRVSISQEALINIPAPFFNFTQLRTIFTRKGLTLHELVVLSGAHTIGTAHCNTFSRRLFNFTGKGDQDPSLDPKYAEFLKSKCKGLSDTTTAVEMDPNSSTTFNSSYYSNLVQNKGLFQSDAALLTDKQATKTANELIDEKSFLTEFAQAMKRLGNIEVLTGNSGEIRKKCSVVNS
ncbi:uncharacterized protein LOC114720755 [Neltuma alba]|uniref:uncharacterized protein LOC114720755 n=1 Tax=Neltuma alba TaxID=207710 RepID=UPI0010A44100|nr:uncharacterized protein LOC114720755 [Prosopis alba]